MRCNWQVEVLVEGNATPRLFWIMTLKLYGGIGMFSTSMVCVLTLGTP